MVSGKQMESVHPKKLYFSHQSQLFLDDSTYAAKVREQ
jgi:hypothetical protein